MIRQCTDPCPGYPATCHLPLGHGGPHHANLRGPTRPKAWWATGATRATVARAPEERWWGRLNPHMGWQPCPPAPPLRPVPGAPGVLVSADALDAFVLAAALVRP